MCAVAKTSPKEASGWTRVRNPATPATTMVVAVAIAATWTATEAALAPPAADALVAVTLAPLGAVEPILLACLDSKCSESLWPTFLFFWDKTLSLLVAVLFKSEAWEALSFLTPASLRAKTEPNSKESPLLGT